MADEEFTEIERPSRKQSSVSETGSQHRTIDERIIINNYLDEYMSLENKRALTQTALKNGLRSYLFRSLAWSIFLECLPECSKDRIEKIRLLRAKYDELRKKYRNDPRSLKIVDPNDPLAGDNPLSQDEKSQWNQYFSDDELQTRIKQDVVRAFPDINFFQSMEIQRIMIDILFNYARENAQIEYKQGMHEILAPIIFVIHFDQQSYLFAQENGLHEEEIKELMDSNYLEHDSYFLFSHVMERIESWYDSNSVKTTNRNEYVNKEPFSNDLDFNCYSKIGIKLKRITEQILCRYDEKLYNHLKELKIAPQLYGIRWMRLLFIREFQMQDLLVLWDAIFADDFSLCDYIFTAMLVVIRNLLLPCDYAECLSHLMRYPSVCDVHYVIHLALHIRDPLHYPEPVEHSTLVLPNPNAVKVQMANRPPERVLNGSKRPIRKHSDSQSGNSESTSRPNELKNISFEWIEDKLVKFQSSENKCNCPAAKEVEDLKYRTDFCARYMSKHLEIIQQFMNECGNNQRPAPTSNHTNGNIDPAEEAFESSLDNVLVSLAELKKIRDILRGTIML